MRAIRSKDTKIELLLRKELWARGLRYHKNCRDIPGCPDIVYRGRKIAVFCDSEFWHGHDWERQRNCIKTNQEFWINKIENNMERDMKVNSILESEGWTVIRFWGKEIKDNVKGCADIVESSLMQKS